MKLEIVTYPDIRLKRKSEKIEVFDEKLHRLLDAMYEKMINTNGIGLAAIQVAHPIRLLVINLPDENDVQKKEDLIEVINPVLSNLEGSTTYQEGCLSVPSFYEDIERSATLTLQYQDRTGQEHTLQADGLFAIALQHEMDHLEGKLFIDKLSYSRRKKFEKEYKKMLKEQKSKK